MPNKQLQPLIFSVITQFSDKDNSVELPLMLFFDREPFSKSSTSSAATIFWATNCPRSV